MHSKNTLLKPSFYTGITRTSSIQLINDKSTVVHVKNTQTIVYCINNGKMDEEEEILWRLTGLEEFLCPEYDVGLGGLGTPESVPPEYDVDLGGLGTPESVPPETDSLVTEVVVTGTTSGGVVRVQRGWSEESGYRSEGEAALTELGVASRGVELEVAVTAEVQPQDADDENEMVLVPSGKNDKLYTGCLA